VVAAVALTAGIAAPAGAASERHGQAQGIAADVTYKVTSLHVAFGPDPSASVDETVNDIKAVANLNGPAGFGSFAAESILASVTAAVTTHIDSSVLTSDFNFLDFRGDEILTECSATQTGTTGTTKLTKVLADGGQPLPDNPAPNTVLDFSPNFIVHLNEQQVISTPSGNRIEVVGMRVVYGLAADYTGSFSVGRTVCQFGAVGFGGGAPDPTPDSPDQAAAVVAPTFTG